MQNRARALLRRERENQAFNALVKDRQFDAAQRKIHEAILVGEKVGYSWIIPELQRLDATCILKNVECDLTQSETRFLEALNMARRHEAKLWEIRTAVSLATLWGENKERRKAYDLLFPIYDWYTEGFDTPDLQEANELLGQLQ